MGSIACVGGFAGVGSLAVQHRLGGQPPIDHPSATSLVDSTLVWTASPSKSGSSFEPDETCADQLNAFTDCIRVHELAELLHGL